jgi:hypothetical protein
MIKWVNGEIRMNLIEKIIITVTNHFYLKTINSERYYILMMPLRIAIKKKNHSAFKFIRIDKYIGTTPSIIY